MRPDVLSCVMQDGGRITFAVVYVMLFGKKNGCGQVRA